MKGSEHFAEDLARLGVRLVISLVFGLAVLGFVRWQRGSSPDGPSGQDADATAGRPACRLTLDPRAIPRGTVRVELVATSGEPLSGEQELSLAAESGVAVDTVRPLGGRRTLLVLDARGAEPGVWDLRLADRRRSCAGLVHVIDHAPKFRDPGRTEAVGGDGGA